MCGYPGRAKYVRGKNFLRHPWPHMRVNRWFLQRLAGAEVALRNAEMAVVDTYSVIVMVARVGVCLLHGPRVKKWRLAYVRPEPREHRRS